MTLRVKILLIVGLVFFVLLLLLSGISIQILLSSSQQIETDRTLTNIERVEEAWKLQFEYMKTKLTDWSNWDDTYKFIVDGNHEYIHTNLVPETFVNLKVDTIIYLNKQGGATYAMTYDPQTGLTATTAGDLIRETRKIHGMLAADAKKTDITGFVQESSGTYYLTARPILKSDNTGPATGALFFIKKFDDREVNRLSGITKTKLTAYRLDGQLLPHDKKAYSEISAKRRFVTIELNSREIAGYTSVQDVYGKDILLFDIVQTRDIYIASLNTSRIIVIGFFVAGIAFFIMILFVLDHQILLPILRLRGEIAKVGASGNLGGRVTELHTQDELDGLTHDLNKMLQSIEYTQRLLSGEREKSHAYIDIVGVIIVVISSNQTIMLINKKGCEVLEVTEEEAIGKNWFDTFVPLESREEIRIMFTKIIAGEMKENEYAENSVLTKSGKRCIIAWHNTVIQNDQEEIVATLSSGEDVTNRSDAEKRLYEREKQFAFAQQMAHVGTWEWLVGEDRFVWSDEIYKMMSIQKVPLGNLSDVISRYVIAEDREKSEIAFKMARDEKKPLFVEVRCVGGDGKQHILSLQGQVVADEHNVVTKIIGIAQDVTVDREREEKILVRTQELESMNNAMVGRELRMADLKKQIEAKTKEIYELRAKFDKPSQ